MLKVKTIGFAGVVLAAGVLSPAVLAQPTITGTISLDQGAYSYDVGGEFTAVTTVTGGGSLLNPYSPMALETGEGTGSGVAGVAQGFQTFCVQTSVEFSPASSGYNNGTPYNFTTSLSSLDYVNGKEGSTDVENLTVGAAWLYEQFATGNLMNNYGYASSGSTRLQDAGLLQAAIWALEGNQTYSDGNYVVPTTANNIFYSDALSEFQGSSTLGSPTDISNADAPVTSANYSTYNVEILNLSTGTGNSLCSAQNQLVYLGDPPVPDGGATLALLALSLAGLAAFGREVGTVQKV
jgi:hypothetical protein